MADSKISDLTSGTTPLAGTEELVTVQGGATVKITTQDVADLAGGDNLGNADLTQSSTGTRTFTLGGSLATDLLNIETGGGTDIIQFRGDNSMYAASGNLGLGILPSSVKKIYAHNSTGNGFGVDVLVSGANGKAFNAIMTSTAGSSYGFYANSTNAAAVAKNGIYLNVSGSTYQNYAINIAAGDINTTGGTGLSNTYTFGGGSSGDIASMTFTVGILTGVTTVP